jgi:hypothetical protein
MEQTQNPHGLDHYGEITAITGYWSSGCAETGARDPLERWTRSVTPALSGPQRAVVLVLTVHGPVIVLPCSLR